jgi:hydroxylaminobenzene mutase
MGDLQKRLAGNGALLFAMGMVTGIWSAVALSGKVHVAIPHMALAAHLNALMGGLWLIAVALTLPYLRYGEVGRRRLGWITAVPAWANWAVTLVASFLGVDGLQFTSDAANNSVAGALQVLVVVPTLAAVFVWVHGFRAAR